MNHTTKLLMLAVGAGLVGCTAVPRGTPANLATAPMEIDPAMQLRDFEPTQAVYPNGDTIAGNTGFQYWTRAGEERWKYAFYDTGVFFANLVTMPFALADTGDVVYQGVVFNPTFHAMPALPDYGTTAPDDVVAPEVIEAMPPETPTEAMTPEVPMEPTELQPTEPGPMPEAVAPVPEISRSFTVRQGQTMTLDEILMVVKIDQDPTDVPVVIRRKGGAEFGTLQRFIADNADQPIVLEAGDSIEFGSK